MKYFLLFVFFLSINLMCIAQETIITDSLINSELKSDSLNASQINKAKKKYKKPLYDSKFVISQDTSLSKLNLAVPIGTQLQLIEITNFEGKKVYSKVIEGDFSSFLLNTANIPKGKIYVHIQTSEGRFTKYIDLK